MSDRSKAGRKRLLGALGRRSQYGVALAVAVAGIASSIVLFSALWQRERDHIRDDFERSGHSRISAVKRTLAIDLLELQSLKSFYDGSNAVERREFTSYVAPLIKDRSSIQAIQWAPRVSAADRAKYEAMAAQDGLADFRFTEYDGRKQPTPVLPRDEYFPIYYAEPPGGNTTEVGFDLASSPACRDAMNRARDAGTPAATPAALLPHAAQDRIAVRVFLAVYVRNAPVTTVEQRRKNLQGFALGVLRVGGLVEESLADLRPAGVDLQIVDASDPADKRVLYVHRSRLRPSHSSSSGEIDTFRRAEFRITESLDVAGRRWEVDCAVAPEFVAARTSWLPWNGAAACLLLTALLVAYLYGIAARNAKTAKLAAQLIEANRRLATEVADRKRAESTLQASQTRYRALYDMSADAIMLLTPEERFFSGNPATIALFGCEDEADFTSCTLVDLSPEYQPDGVLSSSKFQRMVAIALQKGSHFFEWQHRRKDGPEFPATVLLTLMELDGRQVLQATVRDISEQKWGEEQRAQSLARLDRVNQLQEDMLLPASIEEKFKTITEAAVEILDLDFCRIWMVNPGDLCDKGCIHATAEKQCDVCPRRDKCLHLLASSGRYTHIDGDHRRVPLGCYKIGRIASGEDNKFLTNKATTDPRVHDHAWAESLGLVSFAGYKLRDASGETIGVLAMFAKHPISEEDDAFFSNLAEMTSRVIMDDRAGAALRASERRLRLFAESVSDVIWTIDFSGQFTYISPSLEQLQGLRWEDGMPMTMADLLTAPSLAVAQQAMQDLIVAAEAGQRLKSRVELELRRKDGSTVWTDVTANGMYDESEQIAGVVGVTRDITDRRQMEDELRKAKDAAEAATRAKSHFLATMSHEIRTPMTAILGYTDLLADQTLSATGRDAYLAVVRRNGEHLLGLINNILDLSKIEAGKLTLDIAPCHLAALLVDVEATVCPRAEQCGVSFTVEFEGELPETVHTDPMRLRQAIVNLAGNAVKFTQQGGSVRIVAAFLPQGCNGQPAVRIQVIDTGIGIRAEALPQLFQSFQQADASIAPRFGGSGLGLAISRHIASLLGGDLTATSVWGRGSTFTLTVPTGSLDGVAMLHTPVQMSQLAVEQPSAPTGQILEGVRVLLAEDGYDNRELIKTILQHVGALVETAENGSEAVDKAECESFDLILMDMNMPEMDGYEATRLLRGSGYEKPIVALTANAMSGDSEQCLEAGCNEYLSKPIDRARLIRTIAALVDKQPIDEQATTAPTCDAPACDSQVIVSQYIDDPDMAEILGGFVRRLAEQVDAMRQAHAAGRQEDLQRMAHKLKGAGGSYGYPSLTQACAILEDAAKNRDAAAAGPALDDITTLVQSIQNGYAACTATTTTG